MTSVFEPYLALAELEDAAAADRTVEQRAAILEDRAAAHTAIFKAMNRRIDQQGVIESDRSLIPLYQRWIASARQMVVLARESRAAGRPIAGIDDLGFSINRAKPVADRFDQTLQYHERIRRGERPAGPHYPLAEVIDELRSGTRSDRQTAGHGAAGTSPVVHP
jgi:hypothetical protein